jgi:hypothetical protein
LLGCRADQRALEVGGPALRIVGYDEIEDVRRRIWRASPTVAPEASSVHSPRSRAPAEATDLLELLDPADDGTQLRAAPRAGRSARRAPRLAARRRLRDALLVGKSGSPRLPPRLRLPRRIHPHVVLRLRATGRLSRVPTGEVGRDVGARHRRIIVSGQSDETAGRN